MNKDDKYEQVTYLWRSYAVFITCMMILTWVVIVIYINFPASRAQMAAPLTVASSY
jgi:hypothetical protein